MRERREVVIMVVLADVGDGAESVPTLSKIVICTTYSLFRKQGYDE
jgi:hypothetical protein